MNCAFLNGEGVIYELAECTTIGKRQCGLIINSLSVDDRHATIHYSKNENVFILQDLNSRNGTYVNGFRVHTVRLSPGDNIKFGLDHVLYQFGVGKVESSTSCPPIKSSVEVVEEFNPNTNEIFTEPIGVRSTIRQPIHCRSKTCQPETSQDFSEMNTQQLRTELRHMKNLVSENIRKDQELRQQREIILELESKIDSIRSSKNRVSQEFSALNEANQRLRESLDFKDTLINSLKEKAVVRDLRDRENVENRPIEQPPNKTEIARDNRDKKILEGLVTQLQRESISKDEIISRQSVEISNANEILRGRPPSKEQDELQALRTSLKKQESEGKRLSSELVSIRQEMSKQKQKATGYEQQCEILESKIRDCTTENADLERSGSITKIELHNVQSNYEKFKGKIVDSISSILTDCEEISDDVITREVARLCKVKQIYEERVDSLTSEISKLNTNEADFQQKITELKESITSDLTDYIEDGNPISVRLDSLVTKLESKHSLHDSIAWVRDSLIGVLKFQSGIMHSIEDSIEKADVLPLNQERSIPENINTLSRRLAETRARHDKSLCKIENLRDKFKEDVRKLSQDRERQFRLEIEEAVDKSLTKEQEKRSQEIMQIRQEEAEKMNKYSLEQNNKLEELVLTIDKLKSRIQSDEAQLEDQRHRSSSLEDSIQIYKENEEKLILEIEALKSSLEDLNVHKMKELGDLRDYYDQEGRNYREQIKQHSVTICKQEEQIEKLKQKKKMAKNEVKLAKLRTSETEVSKRQPVSVDPPPARIMIEPPSIDVVELRNTISRLNEEIAKLQSACEEKQVSNSSLQREIHILKAKASDKDDQALSRELTEARNLLKMKDDEIVLLRRSSCSTVSNKNEVEKLTQKLNNERASLSKMEDSLNGKNREIEKLKQLLSESHDQRNLAMAQLDKYPKSDELIAAGSLCRGERHQSVIEKQAEALSQLRSRLREFETFKMIPSPESGLKQQNVMLKRELAELKTREMFSSNPLIRTNQIRQKVVVQPQPSESIEPSPHVEDRFSASENLTLNFAAELSKIVSLSESVSLHPIVHMPSSQSEQLLSERRQIFDIIVGKVNILNDRLKKKTELLLQYEQELSRMKVLEELSVKTKMDIERYLETIRCKTEEIEYMKENLAKFRELWNTEKRLNSAIKNKKTFHMENEFANRNYKVHRCTPDELLLKAESKCKTLRGEIKMKDFIISKQKNELLDKKMKKTESCDTFSVLSDDVVDDCEPTPS